MDRGGNPVGVLETGTAAPKGQPDWRNADDYRHLLDLDRAGWAWEWLRRNLEYEKEEGGNHGESGPDRKALTGPAMLCPSSGVCARAWGLCFRRGSLLSRVASAAALGRAA